MEMSSDSTRGFLQEMEGNLVPKRLEIERRRGNLEFGRTRDSHETE